MLRRIWLIYDINSQYGKWGTEPSSSIGPIISRSLPEVEDQWYSSKIMSRWVTKDSRANKLQIWSQYKEISTSLNANTFLLVPCPFSPFVWTQPSHYLNYYAPLTAKLLFTLHIFNVSNMKVSFAFFILRRVDFRGAKLLL